MAVTLSNSAKQAMLTAIRQAIGLEPMQYFNIVNTELNKALEDLITLNGHNIYCRGVSTVRGKTTGKSFKCFNCGRIIYEYETNYTNISMFALQPCGSRPEINWDNMETVRSFVKAFQV